MSPLPGRRLAPHLFQALLIGLALPILAGAGEDENWQRLLSMPREQRAILAEKVREFDRLERPEKAAIRTLDEKLATLPTSEQANYRAVLRRYHLWLQTLSDDERTQLAKAATPKEKLALITKLREQQGKDVDQGPTYLLFQLADLRGRSPFEVAQMLRFWFTLPPAEQAEIEKLGIRDRMKRLIELSRQAKIGPIQQLSPKDEAETAKQLEKRLQAKGWLRNQLNRDSEKQAIDRRRLVNNYYFVANPPKSVTSTNLLRFETAMPSWIRSTFDHLAPEEARRRLTILYRLIYPAGKEIPASGPGPGPGPVAPAAKPGKPPVTTPTPSTGPPI
ncbi:hypothetical protein [Singulisphaera acidiphila]|uniref:DUF3106 domain-containing protein n=1 Tax=Singulisphaera acidiphila (strain ATCC BAA-1392 / DSM 18658 / VKM B-2454 / MOB10) TaxID=886293 RepID=L0DFC8_SINAD|nr:hypothetical protein [Singulisphaera acidiphila]AGA27962.1 Protein of unknown function (DUF3106) [Singulisphaera acidiphila DSM 18658]